MISIVKTPQKYTPSNNPIIWQFTSNDSSISYFKVEVLATPSSNIISVMDCYITPDYPSGGYIDLSKVLTSYVSWEIKNDGLLIQPVSNPIASYRLRITEKLMDGTTGSVHEVSTENYFVWEASMDRIFFNGYKQIDYVVTPSNAAKFLTNKPDFSFVNNVSNEMLYFIQEGMDALNVVVKTYNTLRQIVDTKSFPISGLSSKSMFRILVAPKFLQANLLLDFTTVAYYTIQIVNTSNTAKSELRTYQYTQNPCNKSVVNLFWLNSLGGFDAYQFINPQQTVNTNKYSIKKNIFKLDANGIFSDYNNGIYNPAETIIESHPTSTAIVYSKQLNDGEAKWFTELYQSKQVYIELQNGDLVPAIVNNNSYQVQENKYLTNSVNQAQVELAFGESISAITIDYSNITTGSITAPSFDTLIVFNTSNSTYTHGVSATILSTNSTSKFEFNQINPFTGTPNTMDVYVSGSLYMVVDFVSDYLGKPCGLTKSNGTNILTTFQTGIVNI